MVGYWNQDPTRVRLFEQEKLESERLDEANCPADCQSESAHQMHEVIARGCNLRPKGAEGQTPWWALDNTPPLYQFQFTLAIYGYKLSSSFYVKFMQI